MIFYQIFTNCWVEIGLKMKNAQNLMKLGWIDISNMTISILMSKMIFIKYLPPLRPKFSWLRDLIKFLWTFATCYAKICLWAWIPVLIIKCKIIFMKYTAYVYYYPSLIDSTLSRCFMTFCVRLFLMPINFVDSN